MEPQGCIWSRRVSAAASIVILAAACRQNPVDVDSSALQVRANVIPTEIAASDDPHGGRVQVVVSITNPRAQPIVVQLGGPPYKSGQIPAAETSGFGFGVRVLGADGGPSAWTWGQPTMMLGSRATVRHTFVIEVRAERTGGLSVTPGTYRVVASFGRQEAAPIELRVLP